MAHRTTLIVPAKLADKVDGFIAKQQRCYRGVTMTYDADKHELTLEVKDRHAFDSVYVNCLSFIADLKPIGNNQNRRR